MKMFGLVDLETGLLMGVDVNDSLGRKTYALEFSYNATVFLWTTDNKEDAERVANSTTNECSCENSYMFPQNDFATADRLNVVEFDVPTQGV